MSRPRDIDVMRMYVADNLSQCCAEILEWQKTSVLRDGCVRTAAAMLTSCKPDELRVVECEVARAAMSRLSLPTSPEGPREGEHP